MPYTLTLLYNLYLKHLLFVLCFTNAIFPLAVKGASASDSMLFYWRRQVKKASACEPLTTSRMARRFAGSPSSVWSKGGDTSRPASTPLGVEGTTGEQCTSSRMDRCYSEQQEHCQSSAQWHLPACTHLSKLSKTLFTRLWAINIRHGKIITDALFTVSLEMLWRTFCCQ